MADLDEGLEDFYEEFENVKKKKMKLFGITMTPTAIGALFALLGSIGGTLYAGFEFYKDYMDMKEIVQNVDVDAIEAANELQVQKLNDAITYTQDIKDDLKTDIRMISSLVATLETQIKESEAEVRALRGDVYDKLDTFEERLRLELKDNQTTMATVRDSINSQLEASENRIKDTQASIERTLEGVRGEMNELQKDVTKSIREVEGTVRESEKDVRDTMRLTEDRIDESMRKLDKDIREVLQEALDNPLSN